MHPAGEYFDCHRLGPGWAYLLQVAALDPAGELGQCRFQYVQITDHAPAVELLAIHHDLNPVIMIMKLPFRPRQSGHDVERTDISAQPDFTCHRRHSCRSQERHASTRVSLRLRPGTPRRRGRTRRRGCTAVLAVVRPAVRRSPDGAETRSRCRTAGPEPWKPECCGWSGAAGGRRRPAAAPLVWCRTTTRSTGFPRAPAGSAPSLARPGYRWRQ